MKNCLKMIDIDWRIILTFGIYHWNIPKVTFELLYLPNLLLKICLPNSMFSSVARPPPPSINNYVIGPLVRLIPVLIAWSTSCLLGNFSFMTKFKCQNFPILFCDATEISKMAAGGHSNMAAINKNKSILWSPQNSSLMFTLKVVEGNILAAI